MKTNFSKMDRQKIEKQLTDLGVKLNRFYDNERITLINRINALENKLTPSKHIGKCDHCGNPVIADYQYLEFKHDRIGHRFFKIHNLTKETYQIVIETGPGKRGKPHMKGMYRIAYNSFIGNYGHHIYNSYLKTVDSKTWNNAIDSMSNELKTIDC